MNARKFKLGLGIIALVVILAPARVASAPVVKSAEVPKTYTVQAEDKYGGLEGRFGRENADFVCKLNWDELKGNCGLIHVGQVLKLPENVVPKGARVHVAKQLRKPQLVESVSAPTEKGEILYRVVGRAPLLNCGKKSVDVINEEAWVALGLSEEDKVYLRGHIDRTGPRINITAKEGLVQILPGVRFEQVTFCRKGSAVAVGPMRTAWDADKAVYGERFVLPSGRALVWMRNCFNWITWQPPVKPVELPPVEEIPPVVLPQEPPPQEELPIIPAGPQVPKEEKQLCLLDPKAVIGQEHEPKHSGNDSHSTFLTAALYCTWRGEQGTHGVGVGTQDSWWNGKVNLGAGRYSGNLVSFGPAYEYISDNSWTFEGKLLFGRINENFRQSDYASHREIDFVGPSLSLNLYERRERGEKWLPETRLFAMAGFATDVRAGHTWQGKPIDDTKALSEFGGLFQAGVHQDIYDASKLTLWGRAGYFLEDPSSETANLRIGISDPHRICGIGAGTDFDLKNGGEAFGWGWWCDVVKGAQVTRTEYRLNQVEKEHNVTFQEDGTAMIPVPPPNR